MTIGTEVNRIGYSFISGNNKETPIKARVDAELKALADAHKIETQAAVKNLCRTTEGEVTFGKSCSIRGVSASEGAMKILADLFTVSTKSKGVSIS